MKRTHLEISGSAPAGAPRNDAENAATCRQPLKNICCVGDDDQSIYGWRGAEVDNILRFEHDFPGAKVIRLERNYRSTGHILAAASHLIAHNEGRLGKTLRTEDVDGEKVTVTGSWDSKRKPAPSARRSRNCSAPARTSTRSRSWCGPRSRCASSKTALSRLGLPYRVIGGPRFYERAEIRDALAYLRVINSPADDLAFERIVNVPEARARRRHRADAARPRPQAPHSPVRGRPRRGRDRRAEAEGARVAARSHPAFRPLARAARGDRHIPSSPKSCSTRAATPRCGRRTARPTPPAGSDNLKELVRSMEEFENLQGFLEHISLVMDRDGGAEDEAVSLMTLHSAKGLEFDNVFLPGWEEGLFPSQRTLDEQGRAGLEEERRLAHVGLTRARRRAKLYFATNRRIHGTWSTTIPSRFLDELPAANVEITESKGGSGWGGSGGYGPSRFDNVESFGSSYTTPGWQRAQANRARNQGGRRTGPRRL